MQLAPHTVQHFACFQVNGVRAGSDDECCFTSAMLNKAMPAIIISPILVCFRLLRRRRGERLHHELSLGELDGTLVLRRLQERGDPQL